MRRLNINPEVLRNFQFRSCIISPVAMNTIAGGNKIKLRGYKPRITATRFRTSIAYKFDIDNPPRMDKTAFSIKKHDN